MARKYDNEYKIQAVKLAEEIGGNQAAEESGIPEGYNTYLAQSSQIRFFKYWQWRAYA